MENNKIDYQKKIIKDTKKFRPEPKYPVYPPYHEGLYMEDYFFNFFIENKIELDRIYIPIFWTNIYNNNGIGKNDILQNYLNTLDQNLKYFTACQHEEAPIEKLPPNTLIFSASGKIHQYNKSNNHIPIPLICSKIKEPQTKRKRNIFCSFVGSDTHIIRKKLTNELIGDEKYVVEMGDWNSKVSKNKEKKFIDLTEKSVFTLCPRGDGLTSFRLYEAMQLGSIPVYVYDIKWTPYEKEIDWSDLCVFVEESEISHIKEILENIPKEKIEYMRSKISQTYDEWFSLEGMCKKIIQKLENEKMRLLTFYSDSHDVLFKNYFKPSVDRINEYSLISENYDQIGDGDFMKYGWKESMLKKLEFILKTINECWGDYFVFADADVIFIDNTIYYLLKEVNGFDAAFQNDYNGICAGFFIMNSNTRSLNFIKECIRKYNQYPEIKQL